MYGAGKVKIWDKGEYELITKSKKIIKFVLHGKRLKGTYALIPFPKAGENAWLIIKE
jgi:hypothetical protein